jgi:hypothetical protein
MNWEAAVPLGCERPLDHGRAGGYRRTVRAFPLDVDGLKVTLPLYFATIV